MAVKGEAGGCGWTGAVFSAARRRNKTGAPPPQDADGKKKPKVRRRPREKKGCPLERNWRKHAGVPRHCRGGGRKVFMIGHG